jgi:hypothetical protein
MQNLLLLVYIAETPGSTTNKKSHTLYDCLRRFTQPGPFYIYYAYIKRRFTFTIKNF